MAHLKVNQDGGRIQLHVVDLSSATGADVDAWAEAYGLTRDVAELDDALCARVNECRVTHANPVWAIHEYDRVLPANLQTILEGQGFSVVV